ncbi:MAG TPA: carboxypeptidase-like regulatory domain-containing protein [Balneolales bacterium]|nr:carboxypeptidase-like regulatory domain-containing protein [Balneolales bacterium]
MIKRALYSTLLLTLIVGISYINSYAQSNEANAQTKAATLSGTVVDASTGNPISEIEVQLKGTEESATTDSTGHFEFMNMENGTHTVYINADGYKEYTQDVDLSQGDAQVTIKLEAVSNDEEDSNNK